MASLGRVSIAVHCAWLIVATLLAGCQHYASNPLDRSPVAFAPVEPAVLSIDAARIKRPFLTAQPIDLSQPLTPNALAVITVVANPELKALRAKSGVTDAQAFAALLLPDPAVGGSFDTVISGPDQLDGFGGSIGFDLGQIRTAKVARAAGSASKRQVRLDVAWAEWQAAGAARLQGVRVLALEAQLTIARASAFSADQQMTIVSRDEGRGALAAADIDARRQVSIDAAHALRTVEGDLTAARGELNRQLGLPPTTVLRLAQPSAPTVPPTSAALVEQALMWRLDLQALRYGYDAAEAEVRKAVLDQFPNLSLTIAAARDTAGNYTVGPAVGFSLPFLNRNRGAIAGATATRAQLKAEYDARLFQTRADIYAAVAALATIRRQHDALTQAMPALERYAAVTARAARRGDVALATAAAAEQVIRERRLTSLQLGQQVAEQTIALELLSGRPSEGWTQ